MHDETIERIDAAISALQNVAPDKAVSAERIIARLMAARRGLCEDPGACTICPTPCTKHDRLAALSEAAGRVGAAQLSTATT